MQNQNITISRTTLIWVFVAALGVAGVVALILAFRGSNGPEDDVNVIYTNAVLTVEAQQMTLQASQPTATVTPFVTLTPLPTNNTPLATTTLPPLSAFATNTQSAVVVTGCDNSVWVSDVTFPDNAVVTPGQAMTKTWKVQNNGTCAWTATYKITYVAGNAMGGVATAIGQAVGPGQSVDISVAMVAPTAAGDAAGTWKLMNDKSQFFGTQLTIVVKVGGTANGTGTASGATGTVTPTKTVTPTGVVAATPAAVSSLAVSDEGCTPQDSKYLYSGSINWVDNASNESGFYIYINGAKVTQLAENSKFYSIPAGPYTDTSIILGVEAYNAAGSSARVDVTFTCPNNP